MRIKSNLMTKMKKIDTKIICAVEKKSSSSRKPQTFFMNLFGKNRLLKVVFLMTMASLACESPSLQKNANMETTVNAENKQSAFESDLQTMKTANLKYIFVIRKNDNGGFDAEDKKYLRTNLPTTNRIVLSDEEKAFIVGTNYPFPPENLEVLRLRFKVEDYSSFQEKSK